MFDLFFNVFSAGKMVADPVLWKKRQISANTIGVLLTAGVSLLSAAGVNLPVSQTDIYEVSAGVLAIANVGLTIATTEKLGFK